MVTSHEWWLDKLQSGDLLPGQGWGSVAIDDMVHDNIIARGRMGVGRSAMMLFFRMNVPCPWLRIVKGTFIFKDLDSCRKLYEDKFGKQEWQ